MSALGDIVHALPVLSALRAAHPQVEVDWLADAAYADVLDLVDGLANVVVVRPGYARALQFMRSRNYDAAIDLQGLLKSASAAWMSGARRVIGFNTPGLREPGAAWFYNETVPVTDRAHIIRKNLAVLPLLDVPLPREIRFPFREPAGHVVVDEVRASAGGDLVLINPGAAWPNKRWDPARFGALAARMRGRFGVTSIVLWGRGESLLADTVVAASDGAARRAPETSLADLLSLAKASRLMISGDTGPAHLAAAMGTPLVGLYGPTWPERNGPWDPADEVVSRAAICACHHKRECQTGANCINDITVDEVFAAVERRWRKAYGSD